MKVVVNKTDLNTAVIRSQGAIADKTQAYLGIKADNGRIQMVIADRVLVIYNLIDSETITEGCSFIPARLFSDVVKELPEGKVTLEKVESFLWLTAGKNSEFKMKIPLIDNKVWQDRPQIDSTTKVELPAQKFHYLIDQIQFCVTTESPRNFGVVAYLHRPDANKLRIVGSDGFRLSFAELKGEFPSDFLSSGICISKRALVEIQKMCSEGFQNLSIAISDDQTTLMAAVPDYEIYVKLSSVQYPNYQGVLPKNELATVDVSRPYMQSVAKRVLLAADKSRALQLSFSNYSLTLKARTVGSSEGTESIGLDDYQGPDRDLSINGRYLYEVFSTVASSRVRLNFKTEDDPFVVIPTEEPEHCQSLHVLVPIRESR